MRRTITTAIRDDEWTRALECGTLDLVTTTTTTEDTMTTTCQHSKWIRIVYGIERCSKCGTPRYPSRSTSIQIGRNQMLAHGDPCRVDGIGKATFFFVDHDKGGTYAVIRRGIGGMASVTIDRIRPPRRADRIAADI
jgi:hypothetical protein